MAANNETVSLQPIAELAAIAHLQGALMHTDAAQAVGKIPVDARRGASTCWRSGTRCTPPKASPRCTPDPTWRSNRSYGGGQEHGLRAGAENVAYAIAFGAAADLARTGLDTERIRLSGLRDQLHQALDTALPRQLVLNRHPTKRLPNTLNVSIAGVRGDDLLACATEVAASTGSACHSGTAEPSSVLSAMGFDRHRALAAIRLSLGRWTTTGDVNCAARQLAAAAKCVSPH